jgi:thiosulfate reductase cytochrome b subunit
MAGRMSEKELHELARTRVEDKSGFYVHLIVYVCVNALLVLIWALAGAPRVTAAEVPWFVFPLGGWGVGLLGHFLGVFVFSGRSAVHKRAVEKEAERLRNEQGK